MHILVGYCDSGLVAQTRLPSASFAKPHGWCSWEWSQRMLMLSMAGKLAIILAHLSRPPPSMQTWKSQKNTGVPLGIPSSQHVSQKYELFGSSIVVSTPNAVAFKNISHAYWKSKFASWTRVLSPSVKSGKPPRNSFDLSKPTDIPGSACSAAYRCQVHPQQHWG